MNTDRFNFRIALKQADGSYKRYKALCIGRDARGLYARCSIPHNDKEFYLHDIVIDGENAILEQCTGLKDKNGNLIYESDIVQYDGKETGIVLFRNGCFVWDWKVNDPPIWGLGFVDLEIIGNIHEKE